VSSHERHRIEIDVRSVAPPGASTVVCDVHVFRDALADSPLLLCCLPGGGMSRRYFDLDVDREHGEYSMARHLAGRGFIVATIDHLGVGESDRPDDGYALTPQVVADVNAHVVAELTKRLREGDAVDDLDPLTALRTVGVGHSAGAKLTVCQQARHRSHVALVLLGFGGAGLRDRLTPAELALADDPEAIDARLAELTRERFGEPLPMPRRGSSTFLVGAPMPPPVHEGLLAARSQMLAMVGLSSMIPGSIRPFSDVVDVPVFVGVGDRDIAGSPHAIPALFPSSDDVSLFVLADAGHNHNVAPGRIALWDRVAAWVGLTTADHATSTRHA
jgi:pimeloyl-ACP methyl ester carboxylesterase